MTAAAVNGVFDVVKDPPFDCPGSTCSYPSFTTLALCSECADITETIVKTLLIDSFEQVYSFTTPHNLTIQASAVSDAHSGFSHTLANSTTRDVNWGFIGLEMPQWAGIIRFPDDQGDGSRSTRENWTDTMQAYECLTSFCGRRYSGWNTTNGTLSHGDEHIIALNNSDVADDMPWYRLLAPLDPTESLGTGLINNSFRINYLDGENIAFILKSVIMQTGETALYSSPDIIATMDNIARGMSYRMMDGLNSTTIHGEVYTSLAYVTVRWPWITPLVVIVLASAFCLSAVIHLTHKTKQLAWKSSLTPLLLPDVSYMLTSSGEMTIDDKLQMSSRRMTIAKHLVR